MGDELLLARAYNVGLGDCIYVRVPDGEGAKHLLIDCGNKYGSEESLRAAVANLETHLPAEEDGRRRLDLLVATHAHEDHVRGFAPELFAGLRIADLWMSAAMDPDHPQAEGTRALHDFAEAELRRLVDSPSRGLAAWAGGLLALSKSDGVDALLGALPADRRLFVHAGTSEARLALFEEPTTRLRVLAPMKDVDGYYLGRLSDELEKLQALRAGAADGGGRPTPRLRSASRPSNVSPEEFDLLRDSLGASSLAFVLESGELVNNTSVVLLLEWRGRRLLFTGDAEVKTAYGGAFKKGKTNGSWNVMWAKHRDELSRPVDYLKVGHHGSHNATPWTAKKLRGGPHPVNEILDSLLPPVAEGAESPGRRAVVSTARTSGYPTIPDPALMEELGRRVANTRPYDETPREGHGVPAGRLQPQRTDLERAAGAGASVPWVDVELAPLNPAPGGAAP
jgi:hypothetical protein